MGAPAGRRSHDAEPFIGDAPYSPARPRAKPSQDSGGRRSLHGAAVSSCAATRSSRSSRPSAATSWTPTGSPPAVCPIGRLIAGWPVTLNGAAKHQMRSNRGRIDSGSAGGGRSSSRRAGGSPAAGVSSRSKSFAHHADTSAV